MNILTWFKNFKQKNLQKSAESYGNKLKELISNKDQRMEAIEALEQLPPSISLPYLLKRFELTVDHGIQDTREKEKVIEIVLKNGEIAKPHVKELLKNAKRIAWPIRLCEKLYPEEEYVNMLIENLDENYVEFDEVKQERNTELLLALKEHKHDEIVNKSIKLIKCRDENVRAAALECLEPQSEYNINAKNTILELSKELSPDENARFLGIINAMIQKHKWLK